MKTFSVTTAIRATPEKIWALLTHAPDYPSWNPTVARVDGTIAAGQTVTVYPTLNRARAFPVSVTEFEPGKAMTWTG